MVTIHGSASIVPHGTLYRPSEMRIVAALALRTLAPLDAPLSDNLSSS